jgi:uncharacterized membrane protein YczE
MLKEYIKRFGICILGLVLFSVGNVFGVQAGSAGTNAWNTLALGISARTPLSFGNATLAISIVIVVIAIICRGRIGFGTALNVLLIAVFSDIFLGFGLLPEAPNQIVGAVFTLLGQALISFGMVLYMSPGLGCGPRDTIMVLLGKRFPKAPIGFIKFCMEIVVLIVGVLMGAPFGIGTVLVIALQASIFQLVCRICRFEPRSVEHEDIPQTLRRVFGKAQ